MKADFLQQQKTIILYCKCLNNEQSNILAQVLRSKRHWFCNRQQQIYINHKVR